MYRLNFQVDIEDIRMVERVKDHLRAVMENYGLVYRHSLSDLFGSHSHSHYSGEAQQDANGNWFTPEHTHEPQLHVGIDVAAGNHVHHSPIAELSEHQKKIMFEELKRTGLIPDIPLPQEDFLDKEEMEI